MNTELLETLLDSGFVPVICPVGSDDEYHSYNVNADDAACAVASAMEAAKLAFLTDIEGVYRDPLDKSSLISELTVPEAEELLASGNVRRRNASKNPQLCGCHQRRCFQSPHSGRTASPLPAAGVLYKQRCGHGNYWRRGGTVL